MEAACVFDVSLNSTKILVLTLRRPYLSQVDLKRNSSKAAFPRLVYVTSFTSRFKTFFFSKMSISALAAHPTPYLMVSDAVSRGQSGRDVNWTTHLLLVPKWRMGGVVPLIPLYALWCTQRPLNPSANNFTLYGDPSEKCRTVFTTELFGKHAYFSPLSKYVPDHCGRSPMTRVRSRLTFRIILIVHM
jgi:hypothetical protein